jgi:hypothetical protein
MGGRAMVDWDVMGPAAMQRIEERKARKAAA